jgi:hypothetical protein
MSVFSLYYPSPAKKTSGDVTNFYERKRPRKKK